MLKKIISGAYTARHAEYSPLDYLYQEFLQNKNWVFRTAYKLGIYTEQDFLRAFVRQQSRTYDIYSFLWISFLWKKYPYKQDRVTIFLNEMGLSFHECSAKALYREDQRSHEFVSALWHIWRSQNPRSSKMDFPVELGLPLSVVEHVWKQTVFLN